MRRALISFAVGPNCAVRSARADIRVDARLSILLPPPLYRYRHHHHYYNSSSPLSVLVTGSGVSELPSLFGKVAARLRPSLLRPARS
jgi:hypothetical protein